MTNHIRPSSHIRAWTGGSPPPAHARRDIFFRSIRHVLFREAAETFVAYWQGMTLEAARLHWSSATHDAWATVRRKGE